jgi:hypothetical protein
MRKWWIGVAMVAVVLSQAPSAHAQLPASPDRPKMPEPVPCANGSVMPGPLNPLMAPPGPSDELYLPSSLPTAFDPPCPVPEEFFFTVGSMSLMRNDLKRVSLGSYDPGPNLQIVEGPHPAGTENFAVFQHSDTGFGPFPGAPSFGGLNSVPFPFVWGVRASAGYRCADQAVEVSGFYIFPQTASHSFYGDRAPPPNPNLMLTDNIDNDPGDDLNLTPDQKAQLVPKPNENRLNLLFFNAPDGFQGNNGLWLQANAVFVRMATTVANGEINYRHYWLEGDLQVLAGVRYFDLQERLSILTVDDPGNDPTLRADYRVATHNRLVGGQLGFEWTRHLLPWFGVAAQCKGLWGANLSEVNVALQRGDGLYGFNTGRNHTNFAQLYEAGVFLDFCMLERVRLRMGWNVFYALDMAEAVDQVDFNLSHTNGHPDYTGNVFMHGPVIELQFVF